MIIDLIDSSKNAVVLVATSSYSTSSSTMTQNEQKDQPAEKQTKNRLEPLENKNILVLLVCTLRHISHKK